MSRSQSSSAPPRKLYVVATVHLDTQWRWTIQETIAKFIPDTLRRNFELLRDHSFFVVSFEGAFRYMLMKEYYPESWKELKRWVNADRWRVAGSMLDSPDVNVVSSESLIRHILYGNRFFAREFDRRSEDLFLPDCFGFNAALPSVAAHCGLLGFSAQKFGNWMAPATIPFEIGFWRGPDGRGVVAAIRPEGYGEGLSEDLAKATRYVERIDRTGDRSGAYVAMKYVGVGDRGGGLDDSSVEWLRRSIESEGPLQVELSGSDQIFRDLTPNQIEALPCYEGDLLLPTHGTGCLTSQAAMKQWNRRNELLAEAAEKAAVIADRMGLAAYPSDHLEEAWVRFLWHQMHDDLTGTSIPEAYRFSWNDELLSLNQFAGILTDSVAAIAAELDTNTVGTPVVVFNPLSIERSDPVELVLEETTLAPAGVRVFAPDGTEVPAQTSRNQLGEAVVLFQARVPPLGIVVFDVRPTTKPGSGPGCLDLKISPSAIENHRYRVLVNPEGDIASIYDKKADRELLTAPIQLQLLADRSSRWPAWEVLFEDLQASPKEIVDGPARIEVSESGPVRAALSIRRRRKRSDYVQTVRLCAGDAGERIEIETAVDWRTRSRLLKAAFHLTSACPEATFDLGLGQIRRGNSTRKQYEVPAQQWADLTLPDGSFGVSILNDSKYGWDKPDNETLRLTLLRSPRVFRKFRHQGRQDIGPHRFTVAIYSHGPGWRPAMSCWQASRLNQPLLPFHTARHEGRLGRQLSLFDGSKDNVAIRTLKRAEESDAIILRLQELDGKPSPRTRIGAASPFVSVVEVDGQERPLAEIEPSDGALVVDLSAHAIRAFALELQNVEPAPRSRITRSLSLDFDCVATTEQGESSCSGFDGKGHSYPAELFPPTIDVAGVGFRLGGAARETPNAMACRGQTMTLPEHAEECLHLLVASADGYRRARIETGDGTERIEVPPYSGHLGRWPSKPGKGEADAISSAIITSRVAWIGTHRHGPKGEDEPYVFCYLFHVSIRLDPSCRKIELPDDSSIRIFALSLSSSPISLTKPARSLYG